MKDYSDFFNKIADNIGDSDDLEANFECAFDKLGFDFERESEAFLNTCLFPAIDENHRELEYLEAHFIDLMKSAGLTEAQIRWGKFQPAKLNLSKRLKIRKMLDEQEDLIDREIGYHMLQNVILRRWHWFEPRKMYVKSSVFKAIRENRDG